MPKDFQHLPWADAADLSARIAALPAFETVAPLDFASEVLKRFYAPSIDTARNSVSDELQARLEVAEHHVATLPPPIRISLQRPMNALRKSVSHFDCKTCAKASGHECRGLDEHLDDAQLAQPGLCIDLLHQLFNDVIARYGQVIDQWVFEGDAKHRRDLTTDLSTRAKPESAYDRAGPEWKICGSTFFTDGTEERASLIKLSIAVDDLDWPSLCASFWILVHEFICHAQQGRPTSLPRKACRPECAFFEGWMDELAQRLITADLDGGLFPKTHSVFLKDHRRALLQASHDYRGDRYGWRPNSRRHKFSADWELGIKALEAVDQFLQTFDEDRDTTGAEGSLRPLCRLSFRIAGWAPSYVQAGEIVAALLAAPSVAYLAGEAVQSRLYNLLISPIRNLPIWINDLKSLR